MSNVRTIVETAVEELPKVLPKALDELQQLFEEAAHEGEGSAVRVGPDGRPIQEAPAASQVPTPASAPEPAPKADPALMETTPAGRAVEGIPSAVRPVVRPSAPTAAPQAAPELLAGPAMPRDAEALVAKHARELGIPINEARAILWNESRGNLYVAPGDGGKAWGPMQVHEQAAIDAGYDPTIRNADPETNIRIGLTYYKRMRDHFKNPDDAIAAYNRGPGMQQRIKAGTAPADQVAAAEQYRAGAEQFIGPSAKKYRPAVDGEAISRDLQVKRGADGKVNVEGTPEMFNLNRMGSSEDVKDAIQIAGTYAEKKLDNFMVTGTETLERVHRDALEQVSDLIDAGGPERLMASLERHAKTVKEQTRLLVGGKMFMQSVGGELHKLAIKDAAGIMTDMDRADMIRLGQMLADAETHIKAIQTTSARTTSAGRIVTHDAISGERLDPKLILDSLKKTGIDPDRMKAALETIRLTGGDAKAARRATMPLLKPHDGFLHEWFVNSILSGPKTHLVNMTSNAVQALVMPMERAFGGVMTGNISGLKDAGRMYMGMAHGIRESLKYMAIAFRTGENVIDPSHMTQEFASSSTIGNGLNWFRRNVVRFPSRALLAEDEFFKQINYRANAFSEIAGEAERKFATLADAKAAGFKSVSEARSQYITDQFNAAFDHQGKGMRKTALQYSREATFTQDLEYGIGQSLQQFAAKHPNARFLIPFVRTPTNIIRAAWARTPVLQFLQRQLREDLMAGGVRRQQAIGKVATGAIIYGGAVELALNGRITGGGPLEPKARAIWLQSNQPYSFVTYDDNGKKVFTSFAHIEPIGTFLGITADAVTTLSHTDDSTAEEIIGGLMAALARNVTNKTYLRGLTDFLEASMEPGDKAQKFLKWIERFSGSFVPTGLKQASDALRITDPAMREVHGVIQAAQARIPGLSDRLPARLNWLTGDPISYPEGFLVPDAVSPFAQLHANSKNQDVLDALGTLGFGFSPPSKTVGEYEMTPEQYNRYVQLAAAPPGRPSLMEKLATVIERHKDEVQPLPKKFDDLTDKHPLVHRINEVIGEYRQAARRQLAKEDPAFAQAVRTDKSNQRKVRRGKFDALEQLSED